jgi:hypothetical protein
MRKKVQTMQSHLEKRGVSTSVQMKICKYYEHQLTKQLENEAECEATLNDMIPDL